MLYNLFNKSPARLSLKWETTNYTVLCLYINIKLFLYQKFNNRNYQSHNNILSTYNNTYILFS